MKNFKVKHFCILAVFILVITGICLLATSNGNDITTAKTLDFVEQNNQFTFNFYQQIANNPETIDKSLIFSPLSIQTAGGLLYSGANGQTANEILIGFNLPGEDLQTVSKSFQTYFDNKNNLLSTGKLNMANKIYIKNGFTLKPTFMNIAINNYNSAIENIDFNEPTNAANIINKWVEENTGGKIKELIQSNTIDDFTRMYLVNAIYFKCEWENKFDPANTQLRDFYITPQDKIQLDMMTKTGNLEMANYYDIQAIGVNLKFKDSGSSMFILMPQYNSIDTPLSLLEDKLSSLNLTEIFSKATENYASLTIPKFKIELTTDLKKVLQTLHMNTMFDVTADFGNLLESPEPLMISDAIHKAYIEINEEGGEAGAASGFSISSRMGPMVLNLNHPFLYFIKSDNGEIYFMGRFTGQ